MDSDRSCPSGGVTLIDVIPRHLWNEPDLVVRFLEYVRTHFHEIVPGIPSRSQMHLFAGRTAHNGSQVLPLLGLSPQSGLGEDGPGPTEMIGAVEDWISGLTEDEMRALAEATPGPSWDELLRRREGDEP